MEIKDTQTAKNLQAAFGGESMARNKYTFYAEKAAQEGRGDVAELFERMAKNESIHGKLLYQALHGAIGDSAENLGDAMKGEFGEWSSLYPGFAETAEAEGLPETAELFRKIADIEKSHEQQFLMALAKLNGAANKPADAPRRQEVQMVRGYRCAFCGAAYETRPDVCGVCGAIGSFESAEIQKKS